MKPPKERIEAVFGAAVALDSPEQRAAYLAEACGEDRPLRAEVDALLQAHDQAGAFLTAPSESASGRAMLPGSRTVTLPLAEKPGDRLGRYKLLERIGEGGCGVVYVAEQEEPIRRRVALKVIKLGMDTRSVIARFEAERQALGLMDHPNIAKVLDAGATETGRPYFVMELVRGIKITTYCDQHNLSTRERLELLIPVCHALQHAHQKGIVHRDIKPSNILVTLHDGVPVPKVIDFGIAKATTGQRLTDKTLYTAFEQFIGTPAYMSPEQAEMSGLDIDTRSDVYALGVLLYELLTGKTPFDPNTLMAAGLDEMRRIIREQEPVRPSTRLGTMVAGELTTTAQHRRAEPPKLIHLLRGDLDWIVMKALEKDRTRRYETANGLALDLERHLKHEPVLARPPSTAYRVKKFIRRNRLMTTAAAMVSAALLLGALVSASQAVRATRARDGEAVQRQKAEANERKAEANEQKAVAAQAEEAKQRQAAEAAQRKAQEERDKAQALLYVSDMNVAFQALREHRVGRVRELLERHRPKAGERDLRSWEWGHLWHESESDALFPLAGHTGAVYSVAFSPSGKWLASGGEGTVKLWDVASRREVQSLSHTGRVVDVLFSPDEKYLLTGTGFTPESMVRYWEVGRWREVTSLTNQSDTLSLAVSPDGKFLAVTEATGEVVLRDFATTQPLATLARAPSRHRALRAVFAPREPLLALEDTNGIALWDVPRQQRVRTIPFAPQALQSRVRRMAIAPPIAFSPDGARLVVGGTTLDVIELNRKDQTLALTNLASEVWCLAFSPDGAKLAASDADNLITIWDTARWTRLAELKGHHSPAKEIAFSPDGKLLASAGHDSVIRLWSPGPAPGRRRYHPNPPDGTNASYSPTAFLYQYPGNSILIETGIPEVREIRQQLPYTPRGAVRVSPHGRLVCFAAEDGTPAVWEVATMRQLTTLPNDRTLVFTGHSFSPDEALIVGADEASGTRRVWRVVDGHEVARFESPDLDPWPHSQWWGSDSQTFMVRDQDGRGLHLWDIKSNRIPGFLPHRGGIVGVAMSRDSSLIATLAHDCTIKVWNRADRRELWSFETQGAWTYAHFPRPMDFTLDNRRLVVVAGQSKVRIFDLLTGQEVGSPAVDSTPWGCVFSPDGAWLAVWDGAGITCLGSTPFSEAGP